MSEVPLYITSPRASKQPCFLSHDLSINQRYPLKGVRLLKSEVSILGPIHHKSKYILKGLDGSRRSPVFSGRLSSPNADD